MSLRGWAIFLTFGMAVGLGAGLLISRVVFPVKYVDTEPRTLAPEHRYSFLALIARAYASTGNLVAARVRLALFPEGSDAQSLAALAQQALAEGRPEDDARALAGLAAALDPDLARLSFNATPTPTPTPTLTPTLTQTLASPLTPTTTPRPAPTRTPASVPELGFVMVNQERICRRSAPLPLIQVVVVDSGGDPMPGVEVIVEWTGGRDHFFTGLKPELGLGYGDFEMAEELTYSVFVAPDGPVTDGLRVPVCQDADGAPYPGSWRLTYRLR